MLVSVIPAVCLLMVVVKLRIGFLVVGIVTGKPGGFQKHNTSKYHQVSLMNWSQYKATVSSGTSVATRFENVRKEQITQNRH